jgi:hypothetical protein
MCVTGVNETGDKMYVGVVVTSKHTLLHNVQLLLLAVLSLLHSVKLLC